MIAQSKRISEILTQRNSILDELTYEVADKDYPTIQTSLPTVTWRKLYSPSNPPIETFELAIRRTCAAYQRGDIDNVQFVEQIINARNAFDKARIAEQD